MTLFFHEIRRDAARLAVWTAVISALLLVSVVIYPQMTAEMAEMGDLFSEMGAFSAAFNMDKINFGAYGDTMHHLHFHLVPKYKDGFEWGGVFAMNPKAVTLTQEEYDELVRMIREKL